MARKISITKVEGTTVVTTWDDKDPTKKKSYHYNMGANYNEQDGRIFIDDKGMTFPKLIFTFENLADPLTATNTEEYANLMAVNSFFAVNDSSNGTPGGSGSVIEVSLSTVLTDISNSTLITGAVYKITGVDSNLYSGANIIYLTAANESSFFQEGIGEFYNPVYDNSFHYGIFNVLESPATPVGIGSTIIWGGAVWFNTSGSYGNLTSDFQLDGNWQLANPVDFPNNYNKVYDSIQYSFLKNTIYSREDDFSNIKVSFNSNTRDLTGFHPIQGMQWGNDERSIPNGKFNATVGNKDIHLDNSLFMMVNSQGIVINVAIENSEIWNVYIGIKAFLNSFFIKNSTMSQLNLYSDAELVDTSLDKSLISNLTLHIDATMYGLVLKDSKAYNVIFKEGASVSSFNLDASVVSGFSLEPYSYADTICLSQYSQMQNITFNGNMTNIFLSEGCKFNNLNDITAAYQLNNIYISKRYLLDLFSAALTDNMFNQTYPKVLGWATYGDNQYTDIAPLVVAQGSTATININGLGSTIKTHLPSGVSDFYDVTTSKILPVKLGDGFMYALGFKAKNSATDGRGSIYIDIGSGNKVFETLIGFPRGLNIENPYYIVITGYELDVFLANGGILKINSEAGTGSFYDFTLQIHKTSNAN